MFTGYFALRSTFVLLLLERLESYIAKKKQLRIMQWIGALSLEVSNQCDIAYIRTMYLAIFMLKKSRRFDV